MITGLLGKQEEEEEEGKVVQQLRQGGFSSLSLLSLSLSLSLFVCVCVCVWNAQHSLFPFYFLSRSFYHSSVSSLFFFFFIPSFFLCVSSDSCCYGFSLFLSFMSDFFSCMHVFTLSIYLWRVLYMLQEISFIFTPGVDYRGLHRHMSMRRKKERTFFFFFVANISFHPPFSLFQLGPDLLPIWMLLLYVYVLYCCVTASLLDNNFFHCWADIIWTKCRSVCVWERERERERDQT